MGFERTYQHSWNQSPADNTTNARLSASQLFFWKQLLLGQVPLTDLNSVAIVSPVGIWTVVGSSDGVTGAMDSVDRWGSTFDFTKFLSATTGSAHSWICLQSPPTIFGPGCFLLIDYSSGSGVNHANIYLSKSIPTGGTNLAKPTTVDSIVFTDQQLNDGTSTVFFFSGVLSTTGDHYMFAQKSGSGQAQWMSYLPVLAQYKVASDLFPTPFYVEYSTTAPGVPSNNNFFGTSIWRGRYCDNSGSDGTSASNIGPYQPYNSSIGAWGVIFQNTGDAQDGTIPDWPIIFNSLATQATAHETVRGRLVDVKVAGTDGTNASNGKTDPRTGTPVVQSVVLGTCWWPCNAAPNL